MTTKIFAKMFYDEDNGMGQILALSTDCSGLPIVKLYYDSTDAYQRVANISRYYKTEEERDTAFKELTMEDVVARTLKAKESILGRDGWR